MGQTSSQIKPTQEDDVSVAGVEADSDANPVESGDEGDAAMISRSGGSQTKHTTKPKRRRGSESEPNVSKKAKRTRNDASPKTKKKPPKTQIVKQETHSDDEEENPATNDFSSEIEVSQVESNVSRHTRKKKKKKSQAQATTENEGVSPQNGSQAVSKTKNKRRQSGEDTDALGEPPRKKKGQRKASADDEQEAIATEASATGRQQSRHSSSVVLVEQHRQLDSVVESIDKSAAAPKPKKKRKSGTEQGKQEVLKVQPTGNPAQKSTGKSVEMPPPPRPVSRFQPQTPANQQIQPLRIVTPSETLTPYVPVVMGVDATDQVKGWLQTQETPLPDPNRRTPGGAIQQPDATGVHGKPLTVVVDGPSAGPFTDEEKAVSDAVLKACAFQENISEYYLKCHIIDYLNVGHFKDDMKAALPNRNSTSIRKFCQRRYDLNTRGPWTEDEDAEMLRAYTQYPNNWVSISDIIGRSAQSCRDRYKTIKYGAKRETGPWSKSEEAELIAAVEECIDTVKLSCKNDTELLNDRSRLEKSVAWNVVADKLGGRRNEKRCREKYAKLKQRGLAENVPTPAPPPSLPTMSEVSTSKKFQSAEAEFETFKDGDLYDCMVEIHSAIKHHNAVYNEETTVWSIVAMKNPNSRFSSTLRRRAYYYAIENYKTKRILKATSIAGKAKGVARKLEKKVEEGLRLERGYVPREKRKVTKRTPSEKRKNLSKENVSDSGEDEDGPVEISALDNLRSQDASTGKKLASAIKYRAESLPGTAEQESGDEEGDKQGGSTATSDEPVSTDDYFKRAQIASKSLQAHLRDSNGEHGKKKSKKLSK